MPRQLYTIPIKERPYHGSIWCKLLFPPVFILAQLGINSLQFLALPLLLVPFVGRRAFDKVIDWTKDGYGRLLILITVLFGPTQLVLTTDAPPAVGELVEWDAKGNVEKINLPDRLVVMANHQAYLDWIYLWIVACYAGHASGVIILLKASLKNVPIVGWGMQFFRFIFMHRSWAADRANLTKALTDLGKEARSDWANEPERNTLLPSKKRSPLWLFIFPEGTIVSDDERVKSKRYADREGIEDFVSMLHPRSTGLLFCLRTLLGQIPDLQLLDVTIGYPGVPYGKYPQDYYGLGSVFFNSVPPPAVHLHLHLYSDLASANSPIPSLAPKHLEDVPAEYVPADTGLATPEEARDFELWLRGVWEAKEERMADFAEDQRFEGQGGSEVVRIRQLKWYHNIAAFGGGGLATAAVIACAIAGAIVTRK